MITFTHQCDTCNAKLKRNDHFCLNCGAPAPKTSPSLKKTLIIATILTTALIIFIAYRPLFFQILSLLSTALLIFTITIMIITFKKAKRVSPVFLTISMLVSALSLMIYSRMIGVDIGHLSSITAMVSGALIGIGWSFTSRLMVTPKGIKRKGGLGYLIVWGMIFALNQISALVTGRPPTIVMVMLYVSAGLMIGHNLSLLIRAEKIKTEIESL